MDSLTDGTASLLRYDDRRRQLDLLCVIGVHSSVRYAGARPFRQRWTVTAVGTEYAQGCAASVAHVFWCMSSSDRTF